MEPVIPHHRAMPALATSPVFAASIVARLPLAMLSIGLLVHVEHLTGSFAAAGLVAGTLAVAQGVGGPRSGRLVDRRGQTAVLLGERAGRRRRARRDRRPAGRRPARRAAVALAAVLGFATPPVGACLRALLPGLVRRPEAAAQRLRRRLRRRRADLDLRPAAGAARGAPLVDRRRARRSPARSCSPPPPLFAAAPASRAWRPEPAASRPPGGALRSAGVRTLVLVLASAGLLFGATEVAVTAATDALGGTAAAGPLLGLWGVGGLLGGLVVARAGGGARTGTGLALLLAALAADAPGARRRGRLARRPRRRRGARRHDDRPHLRQRLRDRRPRRARRHHHRGVRVAGHRRRHRHVGRRRRRGRRGRLRRPRRRRSSSPRPPPERAPSSPRCARTPCPPRRPLRRSPPPARPERVPRLFTIGYEKLLPPELVNELRARRRRAADRRPLPPAVAPPGHVEDAARPAARRPRHRLRAPPGARHAAGHPLAVQPRKREAEGREAFRAHVEEHRRGELDALAAELDHAPATALMCLEADPAGCHRRVLAEQLRKRRPELEVVDL